MQNLKLPITIDPFKSAQRRLVCEGIFLLSGMDRIQAISAKADGAVNVTIKFDLDEQGLVVIKGQGNTEVDLICQRCNEAFTQQLAIDFCFSPLKRKQQADELPSYYDAIDLDENGEVALRTLVEDELLLAIPLIPKHDEVNCSAPADSTWGELPAELDKPNPFDVLKQLK